MYKKIEALIARGGQCGGISYNGSKICESGLTCFIQNYIQSFCYESCPQNKYWQCEGNGKFLFNKLIFYLFTYFTNYYKFDLFFKKGTQTCLSIL